MDFVLIAESLTLSQFPPKTNRLLRNDKILGNVI